MLESTKNKIDTMIHRIVMMYMDKHITGHHKCICEICGCFIAYGFATAGEQEIRQKLKCNSWTGWMEDYIHTPYYCKVHAPKVEEKK